MRGIAVSNLAWDQGENAAALALLAAHGAAGVEVAPTKLAGWDELTPAMLRDYRQQIEDAGLVVSSLQAIYFARPDCHLLREAADFERMLEHTSHVAEIGAALGAGVAVFGAPGNRARGDLSAGAARELAEGRLARLAEAAHGGGLALCVEPVPPVYGGDFLVSAAEVEAMVRRVGHPNLRLHLDTGCVMLGGDDIAAAVRSGAPVLCHFHAAEPQLGSFAKPQSDHAGAAAALAAVGYDHWVSIEMRRQPEDPLGAVQTALDLVRDTYGAASTSGGRRPQAAAGR